MGTKPDFNQVQAQNVELWILCNLGSIMYYCAQIDHSPTNFLLGRIIEKVKINNILILISLGNKILVGKIISTNQSLNPLNVSCSTEILDWSWSFEMISVGGFVRFHVWTCSHKHYNNMGLFCDPNIIANNKQRNFQKPAVANHNSSQTLNLLRYHNIRTRTIASPSQLPNLIKSQTFPIITASIHCLRLTLYQKLFATNPSPQRLSESTQNSIGFWYKMRRKHFGILKMPLKVCD